MIGGGSYRDCGCDRPQLVDNVGDFAPRKEATPTTSTFVFPRSETRATRTRRKLFRPLASQ
jgi:hypothetical protein